MSVVQTETRGIGDALDVLTRAMGLNQLMLLASEALPSGDDRNGISAGADAIDTLLSEVKAILYENLARASSREGRS